METKNTILSNCAKSLAGMIANFNDTVSTLGDNVDENTAIIATLNVLLESVRSQTVLTQQELDKYI